ncbi:MAG: phosphatase PAP2 family protein [Porphyromonas sp.]|nr:phosphatase PAP2 family protein [Porphyromonas sp.]
MIESLVGIEREAFLALNSPHSYYLDSVMFLISDRWPWIIFTILFLLLMSYKQRWREVVLLILAIVFLVIVADGVSSGIIKPIFQRYRPTHHPLTADVVKTVLGHRGGGYGFVSGHATNFFAFALFSTLVVRHLWYGIASHLVALNVAYSRIYLGMHFISDVIPGILLGLVCGWLVYLLYRESRIAFLNVERRRANRSYLSTPCHKHTVAGLMALFIIVIWTAGPYFFRFYE